MKDLIEILLAIMRGLAFGFIIATGLMLPDEIKEIKELLNMQVDAQIVTAKSVQLLFEQREVENECTNLLNSLYPYEEDKSPYEDPSEI